MEGPRDMIILHKKNILALIMNNIPMSSKIHEGDAYVYDLELLIILYGSSVAFLMRSECIVDNVCFLYTYLIHFGALKQQGCMDIDAINI
jgi:hypothetical protein